MECSCNKVCSCELLCIAKIPVCVSVSLCPEDSLCILIVDRVHEVKLCQSYTCIMRSFHSKERHSKNVGSSSLQKGAAVHQRWGDLTAFSAKEL